MACRRSLALLLALIAPRARASGCTALPLSWSERDLTFSDGMVLLQHASHSLRHSFTSSGAVFLHLECDLPAHTHELKLGELRAHRLLACARTCRFWMGPTHCTHAASLPAHTQFLLVECRPGGPYALLLPLADASATLTLGRRGSSLAFASPDALWARLDSAAACRSARALYVAASADPFELLRRAFSEVAARAGGFLPLRHKLLPPSADRFGWSTARPSPAGVMAGLRTLRDAAVPPRVLLLEEGWQTLTPLREPPPGRLFEWLLRLVQPHRDSPLAPLRRSPLAALWRAFLAALWRLLARGPLAPLLCVRHAREWNMNGLRRAV